MAMVGELYRQQQELHKLLADKDKQIDDYKAQGARASRSEFLTSSAHSAVKHQDFSSEIAQAVSSSLPQPIQQ